MLFCNKSPIARHTNEGVSENLTVTDEFTEQPQIVEFSKKV